MNIFRKNNDQDLLDKIAGYESHIQSLESDITNQNQKIDELATQVQILVEALKEKEEVAEVAETILVETEKQLEEVKQELEEKQEIIEEVIENTVSVSKQAAIQAAIILGEMGAPVVETVDAPEEVDILSQMNKLKGKELQEFYNSNKAKIFKQLKR